MVFHLINVIFPLKYNVDRSDVIACYVMQIWLITGLFGIYRIYEVLKKFTPYWTNDFSGMS